ncbi:histidine kinase [Streptomyces sp. MST-110588]|uniref:sensor histidine kinase n=1 Tax=Streptomyces sp. MST-110588 TaxID=2833628 RepID=UPI001F5D22DB|nr:histidine kinase [Streptomyces sp. MST-110588]UNO42895.1 sensor domain-containing protein [Streptomyces sp. MST-110588]
MDGGTLLGRFLASLRYVLICLGTGVVAAAGLPVFLCSPSLLDGFADFHRRQVACLLGETFTPVPRAHPRYGDGATGQDIIWLLAHGIPGTMVCAGAISLCGKAINWLSAPVWWTLVPPEERGTVIAWTVDSWPLAIASFFVGAVLAVLAAVAVVLLARLHVLGSRPLLATDGREDLRQRVVELSATRAAALDAHDAELRRIERDLHDGAQAGIVAVSLRLGMIDRALRTRPEQVPGLVEEARQVTGQALDSLRQLVRGIYPPVLMDLGLHEAVRSLAALCQVPTEIDFDEGHAGAGPRAPAAVEAAAYFVVSEALTNVAKHSGAASASVRIRIDERRVGVRVQDNGRGGAVEGAGGGIAGIRRRVAAFDGTTVLTSPPGGPTVLEVEIPCGS